MTTTTLADIASRHSADFSTIENGREHSARIVAHVRERLRTTFGDELAGIDVVLIGSVARGQATAGSDIDFYGAAEHDVPPPLAERIRDTVLAAAHEQGLEPPLAMGPLGRIVPGRELETIELPRDDLPKVMRRVQFVLTSLSLSDPAGHRARLRKILDRFIGRERTPRTRGLVDEVLRILRVSNMIAEDQLRHPPPDGGLMTWMKGFTYYRFDHAAALLAAHGAERVVGSRDALLDELTARFSVPSIDRVLEAYGRVSPVGQAAIAELLAVVNDTMQLLGTPGVRERLAAFVDDAATRDLVVTCEALVERQRRALWSLFVDEPQLRPFTERVGLFG